MSRFLPHPGEPERKKNNIMLMCYYTTVVYVGLPGQAHVTDWVDRTVQSHFTHGGTFDEKQLRREMRARTFKDLPFRLSAVNMFTPASL